MAGKKKFFFELVLQKKPFFLLISNWASVVGLGMVAPGRAMRSSGNQRRSTRATAKKKPWHH